MSTSLKAKSVPDQVATSPRMSGRLPSLVDTIYEAMLAGLISAEIAPGEFLSELKLAERFQASRTPVREACVRLYNAGFLRDTPHGGYVVAEISLDDIRELYQLRLLLEPTAAELAVRNGSGPDFFSACTAILDEHGVLLRQERTYDAFLRVSRLEHDFHHAIAKASANKRLAKFVSEVMIQFQRFYHCWFRNSPSLDIALNEHRNIVEAIQLRDASKARDLMFEHIDKSSQRVLKLFFGYPQLGGDKQK